MSRPLPRPPLPEPDFDLLRRLDLAFPAFCRYFQARSEGWERLPDGPALLVGNHNAGFMMPEAWLTILGYHRATEFRDPLTILGHDLAFTVPLVRSISPRLGGVRARSENAAASLQAGRKVLVYPGGDHDVMRPSRERDRVDFDGRTGFVREALRAGVPVVPVVCAGAHDVWYVVARGRRIARWTGLARSPLRLKVFPITLSIPWGLSSGFLPFVPYPARILLEVGEPIHLEGDPGDPEARRAGAARVEAEMQRIMDRLAAELRG